MSTHISSQAPYVKNTLALTTTSTKNLHHQHLPSQPSTTSSCSSAANFPAFHLFPLLPAELRAQIWIHALPPPRLLEVYAETTRGHNSNSRVARFYAANPHSPSFLHISRESRAIAWMYFEYSFTTSPSAEQLTHLTREDRGALVCENSCKGSGRPGILFQPAKDTIYFRHENRPSLNTAFRNTNLKEMNLGTICSIAMDDWKHGPEDGTVYEKRCWTFASLFESGDEAALRGVREVFIMRVWQHANPWVEEVEAEMEVDERWRTWMGDFLRGMGAKIEVEPLRKSRLWVREVDESEENDGLRWEREARPHWMPQSVVKDARERTGRLF